MRSDHNASSSTSGAGQADRIAFRLEVRLHLSFQRVCEQYPDTGRMLMPRVSAALVAWSCHAVHLLSIYHLICSFVLPVYIFPQSLSCLCGLIYVECAWLLTLLVILIFYVFEVGIK